MAKTSTTLVSGGTMTGPPRVHFAFNPWIFDIKDDSATYYTIGKNVREVVDGACRFDLRRTVQQEFDGIAEECLRAIDYAAVIAGEGLAKQVTFNILANNASMGNSLSYWAIWGAIGRGEEYGGDETLRWFFNYPFTMDALSLKGTFDIQLLEMPKVGNLGIDAPFKADGQAVQLFNPAAAWSQMMQEKSDWPEITDTASIEIRVENHVYLKDQNLDEEHDRKVTLIPDNAPLDLHDHVYLRWVDNLGRIRYHLFTETGQTEAVSATSWNKPEQPEPEIYDSFINDSQTARQQLTATRTRTLGAACIDMDEFERLATIARSPIIDVFDGWDEDGNALWHRVNIVAGSYSRDRQHYADFSFSITDRTQTTQEL